MTCEGNKVFLQDAALASETEGHLQHISPILQILALKTKTIIIWIFKIHLSKQKIIILLRLNSSLRY